MIFNNIDYEWEEEVPKIKYITDCKPPCKFSSKKHFLRKQINKPGEKYSNKRVCKKHGGTYVSRAKKCEWCGEIFEFGTYGPPPKTCQEHRLVAKRKYNKGLRMRDVDESELKKKE